MWILKRSRNAIIATKTLFERNIASDVARRLACDCSVVAMLMDGDEPLSVGRKTRVVTTAIRRALQRRDRCCQFPGCGATRFLDAHHIQHWANGGETSLENLVLLCSHHHRALHEGGYTAYRSEGSVIFRTPNGVRVEETEPDTAGVLLGPQIKNVSAETLWRWSGDRCDYSETIDGLMRGAA